MIVLFNVSKEAFDNIFVSFCVIISKICEDDFFFRLNERNAVIFHSYGKTTSYLACYFLELMLCKKLRCCKEKCVFFLV